MLIKANDTSYNTFSELLTGYRLSEVLGLFHQSNLAEFLGDAGAELSSIIKQTGWHPETGSRFLDCLYAIGLVGKYEQTFFLSPIARKFLWENSTHYMGSTLDFEEKLKESWMTLAQTLKDGKRPAPSVKSDQAYTAALSTFLGSMNEAAKIRSTELWQSFSIEKKSGIILEAGSGSGAYLASFLETNPGWKGIFCDLDDVVEAAKESPRIQELANRITFINLNLLEAKNELKPYQSKADILLLSNFIHCQGNDESASIMRKLLPTVSSDGFVLIHDFFRDANWQGSLYDLHMLLNTYNGKTYSSAEIVAMLKGSDFIFTDSKELPSHSVAFFAAKHPQNLPNLGEFNQLQTLAKELGFDECVEIDATDVVVEAWVQEKCSQGCPSYGKGGACPPRSPSFERTKEILNSYSKALVLAGEPPLHQYQRNLLALEREAFLLGKMKALALWAGPCSQCKECEPDDCRFPEKRRYSLEASGVDVFKLAKTAQISLQTLTQKTDAVRYISMLLVE